MGGAVDYCDGGARGCDRMAGGSAGLVVRLLPAPVHRTARRCFGESTLLAGSGPKTGLRAHISACGSRAGAKFGRRARLVREKIIGRGVGGLAPRVTSRSPLVVADRGRRALRLLAFPGTLALFHQPARQHGRGVFFEPGIQQLRDLLAEIGGVAEPRKLVTLQGVTGRGQKKLPRGLGFVIQGDLQGKPRDSKRIVNTVNSTHVRTYCGKVCKSFAWNSKQRRFTSCGPGTS
jgi:hypothetical protein